ncbi:MAG: translation initiation factor IF-2 [Ignavibacteria bacterium]|nr:translation initiation factor IF-2 [Ignavibacteria bacterium]
MSKEGKKTKYAIYKIASELNISKEHLLEYLNSKGIEVKSHVSKVDEGVYEDIISHFKKDKDLADKHQRKWDAFKKKHEEVDDKGKKEKKKEEESKEEIVELTYTVTEKADLAESEIQEGIEITAPSEIPPTEEKVTEEDSLPGEIAEVIAGEIFAPVSEEKIEVTAEETAIEKLVETEVKEVVKEEKEAVETKAKPEIATTSISALKRNKKSLKIVGKISLDGKDKKEETSGKETPAEKEEKKVKRHKKKRLREDLKKTKIEEEPVKAKRVKKIKGREIDEKAVDDAIRRTKESMDVSASSARASLKKKKKKEKLEEIKQQHEKELSEKSILRVSEFVSVSELANLMNVSVAEVITKCMSFGLMVSINQRLNKDTIILVADDFGFEVDFQEEYVTAKIEDQEDSAESLETRPPVVTIMGHVDHGKTSLLDYIRNSQVVAGEAGGITQHIGAYKVALESGKEIAFLDTPGHEAFTAMRARGAMITDIVILVVAADDSVMPQTIEAINHAQAAGVPIIIAINKIDKQSANTERIRQQLADKNVLVEEWGGKYQSVEISAKQGKNIELLLEKVLLEAEVLDMKANPNRYARGHIIEVELDRGKGVVATVLVQKGTLNIGDPFVAGASSGRVRAMFDERGHKMESAPPSTPVQILGFDEMPQAGDEFVAVETDRIARSISTERMLIKREQEHRLVKHLTLDEISKQIKIGGVKDLRIIVKGDVDGSVEALADSLLKISTEEVKVSVIHKGVGAIVESDVLLAAASQAVIVGFHVRPNLNARKLAETEKIEIRLYNIIYNAINEIKSAVEGMLSPEVSEEITSTVEVRDVFKISRVGTIAGCYVQDGKIQRNNKIRLVREGIVIYDGNIDTLKRFKDDIREVENGKECGIKIENFNDVKVGDIIESYKFVEKKRKLENVSKN